MPGIVLRQDDNFDAAYRRFKKQTDRNLVVTEARARRFHETETEKRKKRENCSSQENAQTSVYDAPLRVTPLILKALGLFGPSSMKLLLIDKQDLSTFAREEVLRDQYHHIVDYAFTFDEFQQKYAVGKYRIVIVDFALEHGAKALEEIDRLDPHQRVIILSASDAYSEPHGCAYCVEHYNRRRLKKPVGVMDLANMIRDFDYASCSYYHD